MPTSPAQLRAVLDDADVTFADCIQAFGEDDNHPAVVLARANHHREGELEIGWPTITSAHENGGGTYVMAWIWVPKPEEVDGDSLIMPLDFEAALSL